MQLSKQTEKEVLQVYDTWLHSYLHGEVATYDSYFDNDYHFIGSTDNEEFLSRKDTTKFFENTAEQLAGKCDLRKETRILEQFGGLVFITHVFDAWFLNGTDYSYYGRFRFTNVLHENKDGWRFIYQHFSTPDSKTEEGETIGFDKVHAENQELREAIKRRTIELEQKNRELEIEAALERVRAKTMAMHHTSELQEVIHTVHEELLKLNISIRGGSFIIINDDIDTELLCWGAGGTANTSELVQVPHFGMPFCTNLIKGVKQGPGFFTEEFSQNEKKEYFTELFKHRPWSELGDTQKKETLNSEGGYTRSCCVAKHTSIFIINQSGRKFSDEENDILKRFSKVFEQTYTRFLDLKKAEAQAREAQIEAALERVRAQTMAMHNSEDVGKCIVKMFGELTALGVDEGTRFGIGILNHDNENNQLWTASKDGEEFNMHIGNLDMTLHPLLVSARKAWKAQVPLHKYVLEGKDLLNYYQALNDAPDYPLRIAMEKLPERQFHYGFVFEQGFFYAFSPCEFQPELIHITQRFSSQFAQTYRRYLDLVKAEAQAREAQIEAALERVRSRSMAMHESSEMAEVVALLYEQIQVLGFTDWGSSIIICDEEAQVMRYWYAEVNLPHLPDYCDVPLTNKIVKKTWELWQSGIPQFDISLLGKEKDDYTSFMLNDTDYNHILSEDVKEEWRKPKDIFFSYFTFKYGLLEFVDIKTLDKEKYPTYQRFTQVFEQTYTRFLDLQKAEAQAREAKIEAALEKVRSRTMGMHKADELQEVVLVIVEKLQELGVILDANGITLCTYFPNSKDVQHWIASPDFSFVGKYLLPYFDHIIFRETWNSKESGNSYFSKAYSVEEKNSFFEHAFEYSDYKNFPDEFKRWILQNDKHVLSFAWQKNSALLIPSNTGVLPTEEEKEILIRFSKVFEQAYVRFMDLQKAEAQAREAQIETALERIRSQATSMQQSTDLLDVVVTMRNEFIRLGHEAHYFWHMLWSPDKYEKAMTSGDGTRIGFVMELPRHIHGNIPLLANWEKSDTPTVVYPMDVDAALDYVHKMVSLGDFKNIDPNAPSDDDIRHIGGLTFIMARTTHGEIGYSLPGEVSDPPAEDLEILVRFAGAFDLAHRRFLDLQKAEEQAQKIREERDRLEKALHDLQATQSQLIQSEKLASLGELTAGIAHEIQNPLNFVNNFAELSVDLANELKDEIKKPEKDWELIEDLTDDLTSNQQKINHHGKRAAAIVTGMLQHARTSTGKKEPTDLNALADEYLRLSYHGLRAKDSSFNAQMVTDFDPAVGMVEVIPQDIGRVFLNIINNAFYATQQRQKEIGKLEIGKLGVPFEPIVSIASKRTDNGVEFRIKDNGTGIPDDVKARIFQPFFTTKPTGQGTGLGLSLAYDIVVKGHGGALEVETKEGEGTKFILYLPAKATD